MSVLVFMSCDFELGRTWLTGGGVDRQSRMGLIFSINSCLAASVFQS